VMGALEPGEAEQAGRDRMGSARARSSLRMPMERAGDRTRGAPGSPGEGRRAASDESPICAAPRAQRSGPRTYGLVPPDGIPCSGRPTTRNYVLLLAEIPHGAHPPLSLHSAVRTANREGWDLSRAPREEVTQIFSPTTSLQGGSLRASGARPSAGGDGGDGRGGSSRKPSWEASRPR